MFTTILIFPIFLFIFLILFSELRPKLILAITIPAYIYNIAVIIYLLTVTCFLNYSGKYVFIYQFFNWSTFEGIDIGLTLWFDYVSIVMSFTVIMVAAMVNLFSIYYMANDPYIIRFFAYLALFTFCMLLLVTAADLIQFFIGWELVGLCSYLLINFWYTRKQANIAALKAVLVNRIGDFCFMYAMSLIFVKFGTVSIYELSWLSIVGEENINSKMNTTIVALLFIAVMSKSAQFGLHSWLPDAMEGPTPVSALIHAATMVTAGIFLMLRLANLFITEEFLMQIIAIIGAFTALFGATTGSVQTDIKKIIAFSTCSQLGYMVAACGLGNFNIALFHLVTHAFFKSLLFLCAGIVIHTLNGEQDIRKMGALFKTLPSAFISMLIASLALAGMPYFAGFYSKEMILSLAYIKGIFLQSNLSIFVFLLLVKAAVFTSFYSAKLIYHIFLKESSVRALAVKNIHVDGLDFFTTQIPLFVLSALSIFSGVLFKEIIVSPINGVSLNSFSEFIIQDNLVAWLEYLPIQIKILLLLVSSSGFLFYFLIIPISKIESVNKNLNKMGVLAITKNNKLFKIKYEIHNFFYNRWYFDSIVSYYANAIVLVSLEDINIYLIQSKILDKFTTNLVISSTTAISQIVNSYTTTTITSYIKNTYVALFITIIVSVLINDVYVFEIK